MICQLYYPAFFFFFPLTRKFSVSISDYRSWSFSFLHGNSKLITHDNFLHSLTFNMFDFFVWNITNYSWNKYVIHFSAVWNQLCWVKIFMIGFCTHVYLIIYDQFKKHWTVSVLLYEKKKKHFLIKYD